ncbi:MAG TPA: hypothetical protein VGF01_22320, partial [Terracidiphilus sp.]
MTTIGVPRSIILKRCFFQENNTFDQGRAQEASATHPEGIMLHGEVLQAVVFSRTGFASDAVGVALESGGYS